RAAGGYRGGLIVGRAGDGFDTDFDALLDAALQRFRLLDSADELGCLVEHQILCNVDKPLKRLPRRSHVFEHRGPRVLAIVSRRPCLDLLETHDGPPCGATIRTCTRRFPSVASPTRPSPRRRRFGTSPSSPTSITASRRWPIECCNSPVSWTNARCARSTWTEGTSNVSAASPSRPRTSGCRGKSMTSTTSST